MTSQHSVFTWTSAIIAALADLKQVLLARMDDHFQTTTAGADMNVSPDMDLFRQYIPELQQKEEWLLLLLALAPHIQPDFFDTVIQTYLPAGGEFVVFGGVKGIAHRGTLPTGETALFVLGGTDPERRIPMQEYFSPAHFFYRKGILWLETVPEGEPAMSGRIILARDWIDKILLGRESVPRFGIDFPAKQVHTEMTWEDAVLHPRTMKDVADIAIWLQHQSRLMRDTNLGRKIKPGYRALFYGPPGTGKTLTAALLGRQFQKDVYRVDLSQIVSKYIGETEKNLESVFKKAETKNWILFFDEADALFGKRTNVQSSHDKYANQEVSYLLQRVEDYDGLLILASNFKSNLDDAFIRRFQAVIHFPLPNAQERLHLWQKTLPAGLQLHSSVNLQDIAAQYELSGAAILNAVHYAALHAYARNDGTLLAADIMEGIQKEFIKEEKSF